MTIFQAIIYGIVQGLGEFLPISSSAHLIVLPRIFGWQDPGLSFDVALHLGTLIAVVIFFFKDWVKLIYSGITNIKSTDGKLFWFIVLASIPGALAGKLLEKQAETNLRNLLLIGCTLIFLGLLLYIVDKNGKKAIHLNQMTIKNSLLIGVSQALAIVPGVSRSGITMTTSLFLGLTREAAARFSFLLSTPLILGAGLIKSKDLINTPIDNISYFAVGIIVSAVTGLISIKFLLNYLKNKGFGIFAVYRVILGLILLSFYFITK